ncbi:ATP-binding cassette domain-containing protein [bacterium]|nr:ATP-binding cassette domain-containing protein [bacterium]
MASTTLVVLLIPRVRHVSQPQNDFILDARDLKMYFPVTRGLLRRKVADVKAVDGVTFKIKRGETLGLVGESGCGKTTIGRCVLRLYKPIGGQIIFDGEDVTSLPEKRLQNVRCNIALIFQDPYSSLDPRQNAGGIVGEPLKIHHWVGTNSEYKDRVEQLFRLVGLDPSMANRFPHEFSGGQRQRIGVARALAVNPKFIIADEPVSALDVSIQAQIINLLQDLQKQFQLTYLFIAHDLSVVKHISDRVAVMYLGRIVELAKSSRLYESPKHPYTRALMSAVPIADPGAKGKRIILLGDVPSPANPPSGCPFHPRCRERLPRCDKVVPQLRDQGDGHYVSCLLYTPEFESSSGRLGKSVIIDSDDQKKG